MTKENDLDADSIASSISIRTLIDRFHDYRRTALRVFKHPWRYAELYIKPYPHYRLTKSVWLVLYGIAVCFVLYSQIVYKHGLNLAKLHFLFQHIYNATFSLILSHFAVKIFRGRGTIRQTATTYCTWLAVAMPIVWVAAYPLLYYVPIEDFIADNGSERDVPQWVAMWSVFCILPMAMAGVIISLKWMASVHGIRMWRVIISWIIIFAGIQSPLSSRRADGK